MPTGTRVNLDIIYSNGQTESASFIVPNGAEGPVGPPGRVNFSRFSALLLSTSTQYVYSNSMNYEYNEDEVYSKQSHDGGHYTIFDKPGFYDIEVERSIARLASIPNNQHVVAQSSMGVEVAYNADPLNPSDVSSYFVSLVNMNNSSLGTLRHKMSFRLVEGHSYYLNSNVEAIILNTIDNSVIGAVPFNTLYINDRVFVQHYPE